jgi:hypothetical protein
MARLPDSGQLDLSDVFLKVQQEMLAQMAVGGLFEHPSAAGAATERHWIELFNRYLPQRYRSAPAFVIDSKGNRSRQIDIAIFDNLYAPLLFPHSSGLHIAAESVYAVFEVKPTLSRQLIRNAGEKAASVRALHRTSVPVIAGGARRSAIPLSPIIGGILATGAGWDPEAFDENVRGALDALSSHPLNDEHLDLGCSLQHGAFEQRWPSVEARPSGSASRSKPRPVRAGIITPVQPRPVRAGIITPVQPRPVRAGIITPVQPRPVRAGIITPVQPRPVRAGIITPVQPRPVRAGNPRGAGGPASGLTEAVARQVTPIITVSSPDESLIFFILRLLERLRDMGTAPAADLMEYGRSLRSFQK